MELPRKVEELVEAGDVQALADIMLDQGSETTNVSVVTGDTARGIFQNMLGDIPDDAEVNIRIVSDEPMGQGDAERVDAAHALGRLPGKESAAALIEVLKDHSEAVVEAALGSLCQLADAMDVDVSDALGLDEITDLIGFDTDLSGIRGAEVRGLLKVAFRV